MSDPEAQRSENLAAALEGFDAFSRGDLEGCLETIHPEIEWHLLFHLPDLPPGKDVYRGHEEVRIVWDAFRSVWDQLTVDVEEVLWEGEDAIIARARFRARGEGSGVSVDRVIHYVFRMRDHKLVLLKPFETPEEAFEFAGVSDEPAS